MFSGDQITRFRELCGKYTGTGCRKYGIKERLSLAMLHGLPSHVPDEIYCHEDLDLDCYEFRLSSRRTQDEITRLRREKYMACAVKSGQIDIFNLTPPLCNFDERDVAIPTG